MQTDLGSGEADLEHAALHRGVVEQQLLIQEHVVEVLGSLAPHSLERPMDGVRVRVRVVVAGWRSCNATVSQN